MAAVDRRSRLAIIDTHVRSRWSLPEAFPFAAVVCALLEAPLVVARMGAHPVGTRLGHLAYLTGHRLLVAIGLSLGVVLFERLTPSRLRGRWSSSALAIGVVAAAALGAAFYPMFSRLLWPYATANLIVTWLAFVGLSLVPTIEARWRRLRFGSLFGALAIIAIDHFALHRVLPELHVALVVLEVSLAALAVRSHVPRPQASWPRVAGGLLAVVAAVASVLVRPSFLVAAELGKDDASALFLVFAPLYRTPAPSRDDLALAADDRWFERRDPSPGVAPSPTRLSLAHPKVVLFTIDSLRYEVFRDKRAEVMPHLDALAKESWVFSHAYSTATATGPSLSSIVTGRFYSQAKWEPGGYPGRRIFLPTAAAREVPTIAARLGARHVATFWAPPMGRLAQSYGIVRGFAEESPVSPGQTRTGNELSADVVAWLERHRMEPAFAFTHLLEPHIPYDGQGKTPYDRYLGDVRAADDALGAFVAKLKEKGLWNETILIVSADHGESFGTHDQTTHGGYVYDEQVHVPLVIRIPSLAGHAVDEPVSLIDIGPTVLDVFGLEAPGDFQGQSLLPWFQGGKTSRSAPIAFDTPSNGISPGRKSRGLLFRDGIKAMWGREDWRFELYDLERDPEELDNLADQRADAMTRLGLLVAFFAVHEVL